MIIIIIINKTLSMTMKDSVVSSCVVSYQIKENDVGLYYTIILWIIEVLLFS